MSELEFVEKMIEITQDRIDKAEHDMKHFVKELIMCEKNNLAELYQQERNKLTQLPDADADFEAYEKAIIELQQENKTT